MVMEHLACFVPGNLALGVESGAVAGAKAEAYLALAAELCVACFQMYSQQPTGASRTQRLALSSYTRPRSASLRPSSLLPASTVFNCICSDPLVHSMPVPHSLPCAGGLLTLDPSEHAVHSTCATAAESLRAPCSRRPGAGGVGRRAGRAPAGAAGCGVQHPAPGGGRVPVHAVARHGRAALPRHGLAHLPGVRRALPGRRRLAVSIPHRTVCVCACCDSARSFRAHA